jgi:MFS family permease
MGSMLHVISAALVLALLCTAAAWGTAGVAIASWGRLPLWVGFLLGAALPVVGAVVLAALATGRRRGRGTPATVRSTGRVGSASVAAGQVAPGWESGPVTGYPAANPFSAGNLPAVPDPFGNLGREPASDMLPNPFGSGPIIEPPTRAQADRKGSAWRTTFGSIHHRQVFTGTALALSLVLLLTLFVNNWIRVTLTDGLTVRLDAWDIGVGEMVVLSALEFVTFAAIAWRWRTRWIGVLAVFAGTWWCFLWSVACLVGGGTRQLVRDTRAIRGLRHTGLAAGPIWNVVLAIAVLMIGWGIGQLVVAHRQREAGA